MKRIYSLLYIVLAAMTASAQTQDTSEDYLRFRMYCDNAMYAEAYQPWWAVMTSNPLCSIHLYSDAGRMFAALVEGESDYRIREAYLCDMLTMFQTWLANLDALNGSVPPRSRSTREDVMLRRAYAFACVAPAALKGNPAWQFDERRAYTDLRAAMDSVRAAKGDALFGADVIKVFFDMSYELYVTDRAAHATTFDADYQAMREACEQAVEALSLLQETRSNAKQLEDYFKVTEYITQVYEKR